MHSGLMDGQPDVPNMLYVNRVLREVQQHLADARENMQVILYNNQRALQHLEAYKKRKEV